MSLREDQRADNRTHSIEQRKGVFWRALTAFSSSESAFHAAPSFVMTSLGAMPGFSERTRARASCRRTSTREGRMRGGCAPGPDTPIFTRAAPAQELALVTQRGLHIANEREAKRTALKSMYALFGFLSSAACGRNGCERRDGFERSERIHADGIFEIFAYRAMPRPTFCSFGILRRCWEA